MSAGADRPGEKLLKLDLKVQLADQTITRQEICGPAFYYIRRESPLAPASLGRVSLRHVRDAISRATEPLSANPNETWILLGGLPKLLESLHRNFEFAEPRPDELQFPRAGGDGVERLPVLVVRGRWRADRLAELRKIDKGVSKDHAEQLPDEVELVLGRADLAELPLFPYRITYFKTASKNEQGRGGEGDSSRPLVTLELFNVHRDGSLTPEQFDYQPGEQEVADLTQSYLQRLRTREANRSVTSISFPSSAWELTSGSSASPLIPSPSSHLRPTLHSSFAFRPSSFFAALARIFSVLAVLAVVLLAANFLVGLWAGDFNAAARAKQARPAANRQAAERIAALSPRRPRPNWNRPASSTPLPMPRFNRPAAG